jgi:PAS domain S-box-containing protein
MINASLDEITDNPVEGHVDLLGNAAMGARDSIIGVQRRTEEELLQSEQVLEERADEMAASLALLHATLESSADGIVAMDLSGRVISYNSKFVSFWQLPDELLERRDGRALMAHVAHQVEDPQNFWRRIEELQANPGLEAYDVLELKDGRVIERYRFPQMIDNRCVGIVVNFRDITERTRIEKDLGFFRAIVDSSDDAIISKTLDGIITSWNKSAERLFGYTAQEAIGQPVLMLIPPHLQDEEPMILAKLRRGERIEHFETVRVKKSGELMDISLTISPVRSRDGKIIGVSKIARDITERRKVERERAELLQRAEAARAEAEAANNAKDEFLAIVSHELRTPLTSMLGWAELLVTDAVDEAGVKQGLEVILRNIRLQTWLVKDLLDVSRIITGKMNLDVRSVELEPIIRDAVEAFCPEAQAKGVELRTSIEAQVSPFTGDPQRLQQCVWNLLSNAVKFTPAGGEVQVQLTATDSHAIIQVSDTGNGIAPEFLPFVFERLRQGDSSATRGGGGLGLGLSIVRHIVELHGGTITAQSEGKGKGATFTITLPLAGVESDSSESTNESTHAPLA